MAIDAYTKIISILRVHIPDADAEMLSDRMQPLAEMELDSLSILEVIYESEEYFGFQLSEVELREMTTIDDLVRAFDRSDPSVN